jgi:hypothetical protein
VAVIFEFDDDRSVVGTLKGFVDDFKVWEEVKKILIAKSSINLSAIEDPSLKETRQVKQLQKIPDPSGGLFGEIRCDVVLSNF